MWWGDISVWTVSGWICRYILPLKILTQVNPFQELTRCCMNTWLEISNRLNCQWSVVKLLLLQVMSHGQSTVNRGFSVNKEVAVENLSERSFIILHRGLFMVTLNQLEALTMYKSESNFLFVCWSLTEVSFLSRRAEESSVPGKIA